LDRAIESNQLANALSAIREISRIFELIGRMTGELDESARVNIAIVQQQERQAQQELQLSRLTVEERRELRRLYAKMQGELSALGVTDGNGAGQPVARSD